MKIKLRFSLLFMFLFLISRISYGEDLEKLKTLCDMKMDSEACVKVGTELLNSVGYAFGLTTVSNYFMKACNLDNGVGCYYLWLIHKDVDSDDINSYIGNEEKFFRKTISLLKEGCNEKDNLACLFLGKIYYSGDNVKKDYKKAFQYFKKSCELGNNFACFNVGAMYINGEGVDKNKKEAIKYLKKSCEMGNKSACSYLEEIKNN